MSNVENFDILAISLNVLHNYFSSWSVRYFSKIVSV